MYLCLISIFKNESHIMKEWIEHYINQGVDKFFLIDNGSTDNYMPILHPYMDKIELTHDYTKFNQAKKYNQYLNKCKNYQWVIVCDFDEFIYARRGFKTIKKYLKRLRDDISLISIPWKLFGSNGHIIQPDNVVQSFTKRVNYNNPIVSDNGINYGKYVDGINYSINKCIIRTKYIRKFNIHTHNVSGGLHITSDNRIFDSKFSGTTRLNESLLQNFYLHINHYTIQSYDWFMQVKATRGDADKLAGNNMRNISFFTSYDNVSNDIIDDELSKINNALNNKIL